MKKIIFITVLLISLVIQAQKPKVEVTRWKAMTTTERDALLVPALEFWEIYNITTSRFEFWDGDSWEVISNGGDVFSDNFNIFTNTNRFNGVTNFHGNVNINNTVDLNANRIQNLGTAINPNDALSLTFADGRYQPIGSYSTILTALSEISLAKGSETLNAIYSNLPLNTLMVLSIDDDLYNNIYPETRGIFTIQKGVVYAHITFSPRDSNSYYIGRINSSDNFEGWTDITQTVSDAQIVTAYNNEVNEPSTDQMNAGIFGNVVRWSVANVKYMVDTHGGAPATLDDLPDGTTFKRLTNTERNNIAANTLKQTDDDDGVPEVFGSPWNGSSESPTKNDVFDEIENVKASIPSSNLNHNQVTASHTFTLTDAERIIVNNNLGDEYYEIPDNATLDYDEDTMLRFHAVRPTDTCRVSFLADDHSGGTVRRYVKTKQDAVGEKAFNVIQRINDRWYATGDYEYYTPGTGNIYTELSAANPENDTDAVGTWDSSVGNADITSVSNGDGTFSIRGTANTTGTIRVNCYFNVVNGQTYTLTFKGLESSGADGRLVDYLNVSIDSNVTLTETETEYTRTLTATATGQARLGFFIYSGAVGQYVQIDDLSVIPD